MHTDNNATIRPISRSTSRSRDVVISRDSKNRVPINNNNERRMSK